MPDLRRLGVGITVYCWDADESLEGVEIRRLPKVPFCQRLEEWFFTLVCTPVSAWLRLRRSSREQAYLISIDQYAIFADAATVHYAHYDWLSWQWAVPCNTFRDRLQAVVESAQCAVAWLLICWNPSMRLLIANSTSFRGHLQSVSAPWVTIAALPYAMSSGRAKTSGDPVSAGVRRRQELKLAPEDVVLSFCSMGHFRRKGLWLAIEALWRVNQSRSASPVRLLVIGGLPATLNRVRQICVRNYGKVPDWLILYGMSETPLELMAVSQGFLFPSYSDTFCLAAYEAAGLGLRTYLAPFHGAQALLDGYPNAQAITWEPSQIADVIRKDLERGLIKVGPPNECGFSSSQSYAEELLHLVRKSLGGSPGTDSVNPA